MAARKTAWEYRSVTRRGSCSSRGRGPLGLLATICCTALLTALPLSASTIIPGKVIDPTTGGSAVRGARIDARLGTVNVGRTTSDEGGEFQLTVDVPASGTLSVELDVTHASYDSEFVRVTVKSGRPDPVFSTIRLMPKGVADCRPTGEHVGIVGHFSSLAQDDSDFPQKIADTLTRNLVTRVQKEHLPEGYLPYFEPCEQAQPRTYLHGEHFARALEAAIFVSGDLSASNGAYDVHAWVSDRHGVFSPPLAAENRGVDLDNPLAAELEVETLTAILVAVARSFQEAGHLEECVDMTRAAEQLAGKLTPDIEAQRQSCQGGLGHVGLTREASP